MKRFYLLVVGALTVALLLVAPVVATAEPVVQPPPVTVGKFVGVDGAGTSWDVHVRSVAKPYLVDLPQANADWPFFDGEGLVTLTSREPLSPGSQEKSSFTVRVKYNVGIDYFAGMPDAGAVSGICGYVVDSSGDKVPAVGDFYEFLFWDGEHGLANPDGTTQYFPDRWYFVQAQDTPMWMRTYQRSVLRFYSYHGDVPENSGWSVGEGDIGIRNGLAFGR